MNCAYHSDREVQGVCSTCGRPICDECLVSLNGQIHCKACLAARVHKPPRDVRGGVRFILSLCPGLGHLYLGLFNRGLQFLAAFFLGITITSFVRIDPIPGLFIAALVFFSVFDAREAHLRMEQGLEVEDKGFIDTKTWKLEWSSRYVGYGLVGIGVLALYRVLMDDLLRVFFTNWETYNRMVNAVNGGVVGVLAILGGLWLLGRNFRKS